MTCAGKCNQSSCDIMSLIFASKQLHVGRKTQLIMNRLLAANKRQIMPLKNVFCAAKIYYTLQRALLHIHYLARWLLGAHKSMPDFISTALTFFANQWSLNIFVQMLL